MNKRHVQGKWGYLALSMLLMGKMAYADPSLAVTFASQAGVIAGAAQTCGQPIGLLTARTTEVLNALSLDPNDVSYAKAAYQRASEDSAASQALSQKLTCSKVVADFNNLPLLKPDYSETVIAPLLKDKPPATNAAGAVVLPSQATTAQLQQQQAAASSATGTTTTSTAATPLSPDMVNAMTQQQVPLQQVVTANSANTADATNATTTAGAATAATAAAMAQPNSAAAEAARVQLALQLTDMAQKLLANSPQGQAQLQQQAMQNIPYPQRNSIYNQYANSPDNVAAQHNGTNNPAYNKPLGVEPYAPGQSMNDAMAIINSPGTTPYPTATSAQTTSGQTATNQALTY